MAPTHRFHLPKEVGSLDGLTYFQDPYAEICIEPPRRRPDPLPLVEPAAPPKQGPDWWRPLSDTAKLCLVTGGGALVIAAIGAFANLFVDSWFQAAGMALVGLFYLILFATNLPPRGVSSLGAAELMAPTSQTAKPVE